MTGQEKDKFICQHPDINICWHEKIGEGAYSFLVRCACGLVFDELHFVEHQAESNPDFTSKAGRVQLLKLIKKTPERFLLFIRHMYGFTDQAVFGLADDLSDNDGKFRDKFFKWLGGVE